MCPSLTVFVGFHLNYYRRRAVILGAQLGHQFFRVTLSTLIFEKRLLSRFDKLPVPPYVVAVHRDASRGNE